jgi:hypothetical protein
MARRAFSSQCRNITAVILLVALAFVSYPYQAHTESANSRHDRHNEATSSAATSETDSHFFNNVSHALVKRVMAPAVNVNAATISSNIGCHLTDLMFQSQADVVLQYGQSIVSTFSFADATGYESGWTRTEDAADFDPRTIAPYLMGLQNVDDFTGGYSPLTPTQGWRRAMWEQDRPYSRPIDGAQVAQVATLANHGQVSSWAQNAGVIIVLNAFSPKFMSGGFGTRLPLPDNELPDVGLWSDIAFIEYAKLSNIRYWGPADSTPAGQPQYNRAPPRWILISEVWGPVPSLSMISHCVASYGLAGLPTWENRITFPIGSVCFYVLMGVPHSSAVAWFLINHKYRFGQATVGSITVFGSGMIGIDGYDTPSMLFWITPVDRKSSRTRQDLAQIRQENYQWILNGNDFRNYPHMLKPKYTGPRA